MRRPFVAALLLLVLAPSCSDDAPAGEGLVKAAVASLDKRLALVTNYEIAGTMRVSIDGQPQELPFSFAFLQPQYLQAIAGPRSITFDGDTITYLDDAQHSARQQRLKDLPEEQRLLALTQTFADFTAPGWRPPVVRQFGMTATRAPGVDGDRLTLVVPVKDAEVDHKVLVLRAGTGDVLEERTEDKAGKVLARLVVDEEHKDERTGLRFPKAWTRTEGGSSLSVKLHGVAVNQGLAKDRFTRGVPPGYVTQP